MITAIDLAGVVAAAMTYGARDPARVQAYAAAAEAGLLEGQKQLRAKP